MMMQFFKWFSRVIFWVILLTVIIPALNWLLFKLIFQPEIQSLDVIHDQYPVAIVFGAGLYWDGTPTPVLKDRVATAVDLYKNGLVKKILLSGDNRFIDYNEPGAMQAYAMDLGVPENDLVPDYAGRRTYDTCYRANAIFKVQKAYLVTQSFHLPRALFLCKSQGIYAKGVSADTQDYRTGSIAYWTIREIYATLTAMWDTWVTKPLPVLGDVLPIEN